MERRALISITSLLTKKKDKVYKKRYFILLFNLLLKISTMIIGRSSRLTHFLEWRDYKIVFKRYASLYFAAGIEKEDNELIVLDVIHHFVEVLDKYFGNVCELDLIFNFHQAYFILEEMIIGGHIMESSKK